MLKKYLGKRGRPLLRYLKRYWIFAILSVLFMIGEVSIDMLQPKYMARIVDEGILGLSGDGTPDIALIWNIGIKMILIVLAGGLCGIICGAMANICSQNYGNELRKASFSKIMNLSFQQTDEFSTGSLITRVTNDISQIEQLVQQSVRGFVRCLMFMVVGTFTLATLNVNFRIIIACAFPLVILNIAFVLWKTNPLFTILQKKIDRMNTVIQENVNGIRVVKSFVQEEYESGRFEDTNTSLVQTQLRVLILISFLRPVMNIILNLATVALIYVGGIQVQKGNMNPGQVMAAVTYISQILNGMMMLAMIFQTFARGMASVKRVKEVITTEPAIKGGAGMDAKEEGSISFCNVSFAYPDKSQEVLKNIDLNISKGEMLAIAGSTGCGKTSLIQLIPRFYDSTSGEVLVDGINVKEYSLEKLRDKIAYVPQKNEIFGTTIRENILVGKPDAGDDEIKAAAMHAQAAEFIENKSEGYDMEVSKGGTNLSGGQRQRLAISRALLKHSEIMIFDDSTSALDLVTESKLYTALVNEYKDVTKIIIAQRIATAKRCDRIAVMQDGAIVACDTHDNLLKMCEVYQEIYASQQKMGGER